MQSHQGFRIVIDEPRRGFFVAGDTIKGRVVLNVRDQVDIGRVAIQFWGRSKTKLYRNKSNGQGGSSRHIYRGRSSLFAESSCLYSGQYTHKAPSFEWPFEFVFPAKTSQNIPGNQWTDNGGGLKDATQRKSTLLPPTFSHRNNGILGLSCRYECFVEYKLEATLSGPNKSSSRFEDAIVLPFAGAQRFDPEIALTARSQNFSVQTHKLEPNYRPRTLGEKSKSLFRTTSVPYSTFSIQWVCPRQIRLGEPVSMFLELRHRSLSPEIPAPPTVSLQRCEVTVIASTQVEAPGLWTSHKDSASDDIIWTPKSRHAYGPFDKEVAYQKEVQLEGIPSRDMYPSFNTDNISRQYELKMRCWIECVGKVLEMNQRITLEILPMKAQEVAPTTTLDIEGLMDHASISGQQIEELPAPLYQEVAAGSG